MERVYFEDIKIPRNMQEYLGSMDGVNVQINYNNAFSDYGYSHDQHITVKVMFLTRTCINCGYDSIWNPDDRESKCKRHTYNAARYDCVFSWSPRKENRTLEECFDLWKEANQNRGYWESIKAMFFGKPGWKDV